MSRACCADCEWEADAPTIRLAARLLERHITETHNATEVKF